MLKGFVLGALVIMLFLIPVSASVSTVSISPANPVKGDIIIMEGTANPNEEVPITVIFHMNAPISGGKFSYQLYEVDIPSPNRFTVIANNCKRLSVSASLTLIPFPFTLTTQKAGDTQTITQSGVPSGTYNIKIFGDPALWSSPVELTVKAWTKTRADSSGSFSYSYDTAPVPAGEFEVDVGGTERTVMLSESSPSSPGSSSGNGVSSNFTEAPTNVERQITDYIMAVMKGDHITHEFSNQETDIQGIEFDALEYSNDLMVKVQELKSLPTVVQSAPPGTVYKNLNIVVDMPFGEKSIENAQIHFRVNETWLENNSLNASWVVLYRYHGGQWNGLNTSLIAEDDSYAHYTALSSGFSFFAIVAQKEANETAPSNETFSEERANTTTPASTQAPQHTPSVGGLAAMMAVACAYLLTRRG